MEALLILAVAALLVGGGVWLGWTLGAGERKLLLDELERARAQIRGAYAAIETSRKIADALSEPDPRDRIRGLLDAGRQGPSPAGPDAGTGEAGDGLGLPGGNGDHAPRGPGVDPEGQG